MATTGDRAAEVIRALETAQSEEEGRLADRRKEQEARRIQAMSLRLAGLTYGQIGERLHIGAEAARMLVMRTLKEAEQAQVAEMRELENQRLDRMQASIWPKVLEGDLQAIDRALRISARRSAVNGLDAPKQFQIQANVRLEMEQALNELKEIVMNEVVADEYQADDL